MMGWIIGFAILWIVLRRSRRRMWRRSARMWHMHPGHGRFVHGGAWGVGPGAWGAWEPPMRAHHRGAQLPQFEHVMRRPASAPSRESEFDALKRRYVAGDLSDEQYEAELDVLFSTAEGRRQV